MRLSRNFSCGPGIMIRQVGVGFGWDLKFPSRARGGSPGITFLNTWIVRDIWRLLPGLSQSSMCCW
jgi:hypothetical protein